MTDAKTTVELLWETEDGGNRWVLSCDSDIVEEGLRPALLAHIKRCLGLSPYLLSADSPVSTKETPAQWEGSATSSKEDGLEKTFLSKDVRFLSMPFEAHKLRGADAIGLSLVSLTTGRQEFWPDLSSAFVLVCSKHLAEILKNIDSIKIFDGPPAGLEKEDTFCIELPGGSRVLLTNEDLESGLVNISRIFEWSEALTHSEGFVQPESVRVASLRAKVLARAVIRGRSRVSVYWRNIIPPEYVKSLTGELPLSVFSGQIDAEDLVTQFQALSTGERFRIVFPVLLTEWLERKKLSRSQDNLEGPLPSDEDLSSALRKLESGETSHSISIENWHSCQVWALTTWPDWVSEDIPAWGAGSVWYEVVTEVKKHMRRQGVSRPVVAAALNALTRLCTNLRLGKKDDRGSVISLLVGLVDVLMPYPWEEDKEGWIYYKDWVTSNESRLVSSVLAQNLERVTTDSGARACLAAASRRRTQGWGILKVFQLCPGIIDLLTKYGKHSHDSNGISASTILSFYNDSAFLDSLNIKSSSRLMGPVSHDSWAVAVLRNPVLPARVIVELEALSLSGKDLLPSISLNRDVFLPRQPDHDSFTWALGEQLVRRGLVSDLAQHVQLVEEECRDPRESVEAAGQQEKKDQVNSLWVSSAVLAELVLVESTLAERWFSATRLAEYKAASAGVEQETPAMLQASCEPSSTQALSGPRHGPVAAWQLLLVLCHVQSVHSWLLVIQELFGDESALESSDWLPLWRASSEDKNHLTKTALRHGRKISRSSDNDKRVIEAIEKITLLLSSNKRDPIPGPIPC